MTQFVEVCSDANVLKMAGHIGPNRVVDVYVSDPPEVYKPLWAVVCDDYKGNQQGSSPKVEEVIFEVVGPSGNVHPQDGLTPED